MIDFSRSIFEEKTLFSRPFLIKRDDLIHHYCNGNKARKFASLLDSQYANRIWVSYGGNQSNAMFALAYLARIQGSVFRYVMPEFRAQMAGNLEYALKWGMQAYTLPVGNPVSSLERCARENAGVDSQIVFIPQGGDVGLAMKGMNALAQELRARLGERPVVFYTSGSGVGVVSLKIALDSVFPLAELVVLCCVRREAELRAQFAQFHTQAPKILCTSFAFAKPKREIWEMREYLALNSLKCDLLYDSVGFCTIKEHLSEFEGRELVFIHSGGLVGDISQDRQNV